MKTPMEIASEIFDAAFTTIESDRFDDGRSDVEECSADYIREQIRLAIEADRAQRGLVEAVAEALDERAEAGADDAEVARAAAARIRDTDPLDDVWHNYLGPLLDDLQNDYGTE